MPVTRPDPTIHTRHRRLAGEEIGDGGMADNGGQKQWSLRRRIHRRNQRWVEMAGIEPKGGPPTVVEARTGSSNRRHVRRWRPAGIRPKSRQAMAVTTAVGCQSASGRVPAGRAGNGGHDGGDDNGDQVSGQSEFAPQGDGSKTIKTTLAAIPATSAAETGGDRPVVTWRLRRWSTRWRRRVQWRRTTMAYGRWMPTSPSFFWRTA